MSDSRSQVHIPARNHALLANETPLLAVNNNTPGCERLASAVDGRLRIVDSIDDRQAAAAAATDNDNSHAERNGAIPHQQMVSLALPQSQLPASGAVPPGHSTSPAQYPAGHRPQRQQACLTTSSVGQSSSASSSSSSSSSHCRRNKPVSQRPQVSSVGVQHNSPSPLQLHSTSGKYFTIYTDSHPE